MKVQTIKFVLAACAAVLFLTSGAWAQILKPGEVIYSRASTSPNGNCDTGAVWVVGQDGSNDRFITQGFHPRISPDGRYLLFKRFDSASLCAPFSIAPRWWIRDLGAKRETPIALNSRESSGHFFSPQTNRGVNQIVHSNGSNICEMNLDGSNRLCTGIPDLDPIRGGGHPTVRGSDNLLLVQNLTNTTDGGLYTMNYDTLQNRQKIPNTEGRDLSPAWSNDGQTIAFAAYPTTRSEPYFFTNIFKINADGSNRTQLTFINQLSGEGFSYSLVWTRDNSTILNAAKLNGVAGIYKISAGGSIFGTIPITPGANPEWVGGIVPPYSEQQTASFGGGATSGGNFTLVDTIGQAFAGQTSANGNYTLQSGFWINLSSARAPFDFDGDGKTDLAIFRPAPAEWWYFKSSNGSNAAAQFGASTDKITPGDYSGDGKTDLAVFRPSTGFWFVLRSEDGSFYSFPFGTSGDVPVPADYDGDGKTDAAVFRPSSLTWFISKSSGGTTITTFGVNGDKPVVADYDGDSKTDIAIFRPNGAVGAEWWVQRSSNGSVFALQFGSSTDKPVQGDYSGDGKADIAVWRPSNGNWFILRSEDSSFYSFPFGISTDIPAPGDFDGDGKLDAAIFRPSSSTWFIQASTAGTQIAQFGINGDLPVPNAFVP